MMHARYVALVAMFLSLAPAAALPAATTPLAGLHYLLGTWSCTYSAGATRLAYSTAYAYDHNGRTLRQIATYKGGGDEELLGYDAQHHRWSAVVLDDQGNVTVMQAAGNDPNHIAYHSVYPDASIAVTFDRVSATEYHLHGTVHVGGKTIASVDTCLRSAH